MQKRVFHTIRFLSLVASIIFFSQKVSSQVPDNPEIDTVSIVGVNPIISWTPNTQNTTGYSVYRGRYEEVGGTTYLIFDSLTSIYGVQQSSFIDADVSACVEQRLYKIRAFNNLQASNWLVADTVNTILITQLDFDLCSNSVSLEWTKYRNMPGGMGGYRILASVDGEDYEIVGTTSASQNYFVHDNLLPEVQYSYKIRAFSQDESRSSTSCERSVNTFTYDKPEEARMLVVTVENFEHVKITWEADDAQVSRFKVFRDDGDGFFNFIGENTDFDTYNPSTTFIDDSAAFDLQSYTYRVDLFDFCDKAGISTANNSKTIHISAQKAAGLMIDLQWNDYEGWDNILEYELYREVDGSPDPAGPLATLSAGETSYSDDISGLTGGEGNLAYYVKAIEDASEATESFSNKVTIKLETNVLIPNAIRPESTSTTEQEFKPVLDFIEEGFYELAIFNKWGQQIFVSDNQEVGWKGDFNGDVVPAGTYVYLLKFKNARGELVEKRGTVTVVR